MQDVGFKGQIFASTYGKEYEKIMVKGGFFDIRNYSN
jgi:hypothetical protein